MNAFLLGVNNLRKNYSFDQKSWSKSLQIESRRFQAYFLSYINELNYNQRFFGGK